MSTSHSALIDRFESGIQLIEEAVKAAPEAIVDSPPAPGKWSIRQIMTHVADADVVSAMRFRIIAAQPGTRITAFDQDVWADQLGYDRQPLRDALAAFVAVRRFTAQMLRNLPEAAWSNTAVHEERGEVSLPAYVAYMSEHAEKHAEQIRKILAQFGSPKA